MLDEEYGCHDCTPVFNYLQYIVPGYMFIEKKNIQQQSGIEFFADIDIFSTFFLFLDL